MKVDIALCGGGLQSGLIIAALHGSKSTARVALVERNTIGGNHTWCFYGTDLSPAMQRYVAPFVVRRWNSCEVRFPGHRRILNTPYAMITSTKLRSEVFRMVATRDNSVIFEQTSIDTLDTAVLRLSNGQTLSAHTVLDARGAAAVNGPCGYQKFYGEEITLSEEHGLTSPIVMDATVEQCDGFRFMYVLPLTTRSALFEDTSFSNGPELDEQERHQRIATWLQKNGLKAITVDRCERGVLPMPMSTASLTRLQRQKKTTHLQKGGYRGGWFNPSTGYSLPLAAELAEIVATTPLVNLPLAITAATHIRRRRARFCYFLNRLLFQWYRPNTRRNIFERFYRLPKATIERFYSMRLLPIDKIRIIPVGLVFPSRKSNRFTGSS